MTILITILFVIFIGNIVLERKLKRMEEKTSNRNTKNTTMNSAKMTLNIIKGNIVLEALKRRKHMKEEASKKMIQRNKWNLIE